MPADLVVVAADAFRSPQLLWASGIRPRALGHYLTEHPVVISTVALDADRIGRFATEEQLDEELARRATNAADPVAAVNRIPFSEPDHPFSLQVMYSETTPFPMAARRPSRAEPLGLREHGLRDAQAPALRGCRDLRRRRARLPRLPEHDDHLRAHGDGARRDRGRHGAAAPSRERARHVRRRAAPHAERLEPALPGHAPHGRRRRRHLGRRPVVARLGLREPRRRRQRPDPDRHGDEPHAHERRDRGARARARPSSASPPAPRHPSPAEPTRPDRTSEPAERKHRCFSRET